ncbi:MAG: Na+/H+ antiporter subunit E [Oceanicaulis sp.]
MGRKLVYIAVLTVVLAVLWLLLSGKWEHILLLTVGALSVVFSVWLTLRMGVLDGEAAPFAGLPRYLGYWVWLGGEIFKANIQVVKLAMAPDLNIKPVMTRVAATRGSDMALATFANSITLTPGTVTVEVEKTGFLVHALDESFADQEAFRDMERRAVAAADGETER